MVSLRDVWFSYSKPVLRGVSLDVDRTFICGYNGSGKTTLLKIASGLLKPDRGFVEGRTIYVHQNADDYILFSNVKNELLIQAIQCGKDFDEALRIARKLGIAHILEKETSKLSDGEKRLLTIALALLKGECLALDEPFANLHPKVAEKVLKVLKEPFIIAEHRIDLCEDFVWLENGKICDPPYFHFELPKGEIGEVVLKVEGLCFGYDDLLLRDVALEVRRGEIIAIVGLNGCGKTTLIKLLAGILKPWSGEISVKGKIGLCLSNPYYHVQEPISFGEAKIKALERTFSADILLWDEPTAGLDVVSKFKILKRARELKKTVIMATHDEGILRFCDHVVEI
ncbi:ATP-binding cassette domain-containing protein [Archaeoglobus sp.]